MPSPIRNHSPTQSHDPRLVEGVVIGGRSGSGAKRAVLDGHLDWRLHWHRLLEPVSSTHPSGPNLEYTAEFAELERTARGTPDRQIGAALLPGQPPDPEAVLQQASALLEQTKDLRVAMHLLRASLASAGLGAFLTGVAALRSLLERFWDTLHPGLDPEDDAHATARANAIVALGSPELICQLRRSALIESVALGTVSLEQARTAAQDAGSTGQPSSGEGTRLRAAFGAQPAAVLNALADALERALDDTRAVGATFQAHAASAPDLEPLSRYFAEALGLVRTQQSHAEPSAALDRNAPAPPDARQRERPSRIRDRSNVIQCLEEMCAYYREREPSSPLPLLLERCQRLASLDFLEILQELAPEALPKVDLIHGANPSRVLPK